MPFKKGEPNTTRSNKKIAEFEAEVDKAVEKMTPIKEIVSEAHELREKINPVSVSDHSHINVGQYSSTSEVKTPPKYVIISMKDSKKLMAGGSIRLTNHDGKHELKDKSGNVVDVYTLNKAEEMFDMNNEIDRLIVQNALSQPAFYTSRAPSTRLYEITNLEDEAKNTIEVLEAGLDAGVILKNLGVDGRASFARLHGIDSDKRTPERTYADLIEIVKRNPDEVIKSFNDPDREFREVLRRAQFRKKSNVEIKNGNWMYGSEVMGSTFDQAIEWCHRNADILNLIDKNSK